MKCQRRTDTSMGCPAMHRREVRENLKGYKERLANIKPTIDTRPPAPQPHLTLYGRDYAAKKKATTEAAFADLKMIQAIARTMTRKHEVAERKGPVSLNADARKQEIYRVMQENHRLLDHIETVGAFCSTTDLVAEHKFKQRYVINASHTMRLSGEYDQDMQRIRREDKQRFEASQRSLQLRREAAERLGKTTGSISLPSLTSAASSEPAPPPAARQGAKKAMGPSKGWSGSPGEANAVEARRGGHRQQAKAAKIREPAGAAPPKATEPAAARTAPRPAVRFAAPEPTPISTEIGDDEVERSEDAISTPLRRRAARKGTPHPSKLVKAPSVAESEASDTCEAAHISAAELEEAALNAMAMEEAIVVEDDFVPDPPAPPSAPAPDAARAQEETAEPEEAPAPPPGEYEDDFDEEPEEEEPRAAAPRYEEPPADDFKEAAGAVGLPPEETEEAPATTSAPSQAAPGAAEPAPQEHSLPPVSPKEPPPVEVLPLAAEEIVLKTPPGSEGYGDFEDSEEQEASMPKLDKVASREPSPKANTPAAQPAAEAPSPAQSPARASPPSPASPASPGAVSEGQAAAAEPTPAVVEPPVAMPEPAVQATEAPTNYNEDSFEDDFESSGEKAPQQTAVLTEAEPAAEEPTVELVEAEGVHSPVEGVEPVAIARPAKQDAGAEDQGQDEYEEDYEDDFLNESAALGTTQERKNNFEFEGFEEETFEDDEGDDEES